MVIFSKILSASVQSVIFTLVFYKLEYYNYSKSFNGTE